MNPGELIEAQHKICVVFFQDLKQALEEENMTVQELVDQDLKLDKYRTKIAMSLLDPENYYYDFSLETIARIAAALPKYELVVRIYDPKTEELHLSPFPVSE